MAVGIVPNPAYREMADRARMYGQNDLARIYIAMEQAHRGCHGVATERYVYDSGPGEFVYMLRHPEPDMQAHQQRADLHLELARIGRGE